MFIKRYIARFLSLSNVSKKSLSNQLLTYFFNFLMVSFLIDSVESYE